MKVVDSWYSKIRSEDAKKMLRMLEDSYLEGDQTSIAEVWKIEGIMQEALDWGLAEQLQLEENRKAVEQFIEKIGEKREIEYMSFLLAESLGDFVWNYGVDNQLKYNNRVIPGEDIIFNPAGDGNCFYAAILGNQNASPEAIRQLRNDVAVQIQNNVEVYFERIMLEAFSYYQQYGTLPRFFTRINTSLQASRLLEVIRNYGGHGSFDNISIADRENLVKEYAEHIRQDKVWAGNIEIGVITEMMDARITVHRPDGQFYDINRGGSNHINLYYTGNHYVRVSDREDSIFEMSRRGELTSLEGESTEDSDGLLIQEIEDNLDVIGANKQLVYKMLDVSSLIQELGEGNQLYLVNPEGEHSKSIKS